jgi:alkanesulfonate monooxygenase SsuD/methylene tetrahydromethanopterin reductase-like flavin-dependent oxidoreductase (luciferase family)
MPFRNPALVAKIAETLDFLSDGRFALGIGSGGGPDIEYESFGIDYDHRHARFVEALQIITGLLREGAVDFEGSYYRAPECILRPRGPRPEGLPIIIGAEGPKMLRLAAEYADEWNGLTFQTATPDRFIPLFAAVDAACEDTGRDPSTLRRSIDIAVAPETDEDPQLPGFGPPLHGKPAVLAAQLAELAALGIDEIRTYLWPQTMESVEAMGDVIKQLDAA